MRLIFCLCMLLVFCDLVSSLAFQAVPIIRENGAFYLVRPEEGEKPGHILLKALVSSGEMTYQDSFDVSLLPRQEEPETENAQVGQDAAVSSEDLIRSELRGIAAGFNEDRSSRRILLPGSLPGGQQIQWNVQRKNHVLMILVFGSLLMTLVWRSRLKPLHKKQEENRACVLHHLPTFTGQLVLLLDAGLVPSRAFEITASGFLRQDAAEDDYFCRHIRSILHSMGNTNGAMHEELQRFARESGVRELMRISNIITDNINKGSELNRKLEQESGALWSLRKHRCEERGRLAETKMTIPLAVFLSVLLIITVSPALLQLQQ